MSRTFRLTKAPYDVGDNIYNKATFTFEAGVTILVGCNGSGKTTLIELIQEKLRKEDIPYYEYDNYKDGASMGISRAMFNNDIKTAASMMCASEGEKITYNMTQRAREIGNFVKKHENNKELWIFFDAIDSGLSIDNVCDIKEYLFKPILEDNRFGKKAVYIICSANAYEFACDNPCMDIQNAKYITFNNYEEYKNFILKSKKRKDKRFEKRQKCYN